MPHSKRCTLALIFSVLLVAVGSHVSSETIVIGVAEQLDEADVIETALSGHFTKNLGVKLRTVGIRLSADGDLAAAKGSNGANVIVGPAKLVAAICKIRLRARMPCNAIVKSQRIALLAPEEAMITELTDIFKRPELLGDTAIVWPPTTLMGEYLHWSGVPAKQIPDLLSSKRGFQYAFDALFAGTDTLVWCQTAKAATQAVLSGTARSVITNASDVFEIWESLTKATDQIDLKVWVGTHLAIAWPDTAWIILGDGERHRFRDFALNHGFQPFDIPNPVRGDDAWHAALETAFSAHPGLPSTNSQSIDCTRPIRR